jgi:hypothetical protein
MAKNEALNSEGLKKQKEDLAREHGYEPCPALEWEKVGVASNVRSGLQPINGVRCLPENGTTGWYIWAGETMSNDPDFFEPLHVAHLQEWCPAVIPFLELPPGWRFLIAPGYQDVWFDHEVGLSPAGVTQPE